MKVEPRVWRALFIPALILAVGACSSPEDTATEPGLQRDHAVNLEFGDDGQIGFINTIETGAPWLTSSDFISFPRATAVDERLGRLYISEQHGVRVVDLNTGDLSLFADGIGTAHGIAVAPDGRVFVVDADRKAVLAFNSSNEYLFEIVLEQPKGLAIDGERNRLYVADAGDHTVSAWSLNGEFLFNLEIDGADWALPLQPAVNSKGDVYVVSWNEPAVHVFNADGAFLRGFGDRGTYPTQFTRPKGIAIDSDDNVYVSDAAFGNIQIFTPEDRLALWFGTGGDAIGQFNIPGFMTFDSQDRLFIPEYGSHRVQVYQYQAQ